MSNFFYSDNEDNNNKESINKYKYLFLSYEKEKPSLRQALDQMFISSNADSNKSKDLVDDILSKCISTIKENFEKINQEYPNFSMEDANIICSYTCESKDKEFSPYRLLNRNLVSENRIEGIEKISKYLYILLKSLRKLKRYYPYKENKYLYRCINNKVSLSENPFNPKYIPYKKGNIKTFWGFTSTSTNPYDTFNFLNKGHKMKSGTIFKLGGDIWGYNITLFNYYGEDEILLEPERTYLITDVLPPLNEIINIDCQVYNTPLVLDNNNSYEYNKNNIEDISKINNTNNIVRLINEREKECICKCICNIEQEIIRNGINKCIIGLGILCNIPKKNMKAFITYNHLIDFEFLNNEKKIMYYNYKKEKKEINIKLNRYKYTNKKIDITIIEIIEEDNINNYLKIDDNVGSKEYNDRDVLYIKFNEDIFDKFGYIQSKIIKIDENYVINNVRKEGIILLKKNLKLIGVYNNEKYIHMNKIINSINFIIGKIEITTEDIGKEIQLINNKNEYDYGINNDIEKNILIIINGKIYNNILTFNFDTVGVKKIYYMSEDLTNMSYMFGDCCKLKEINLESFDTSQVINMTYMFWGCFGLKQINLKSFDTSKVTNMSGMFGGCSGLKELKLPDSFDTSKVTNMSYMFSRCSGLKKIDFPEKFNTASVTNMQEMFFKCSALENIFLQRSFITDEVTNMSYMFSGCSKLKNIYITRSFNTNKVNNMSCMFSGCSELSELNLESFKAKPNVTNISCMFKDIPRSCNFKCDDISLINQFNNDTSCLIF